MRIVVIGGNRSETEFPVKRDSFRHFFQQSVEPHFFVTDNFRRFNQSFNQLFSQTRAAKIIAHEKPFHLTDFIVNFS